MSAADHKGAPDLRCSGMCTAVLCSESAWLLRTKRQSVVYADCRHTCSTRGRSPHHPPPLRQQPLTLRTQRSCGSALTGQRRRHSAPWAGPPVCRCKPARYIVSSLISARRPFRCSQHALFRAAARTPRTARGPCSQACRSVAVSDWGARRLEVGRFECVMLARDLRNQLAALCTATSAHVQGNCLHVIDAPTSCRCGSFRVCCPVLVDIAAVWRSSGWRAQACMRA